MTEVSHRTLIKATGAIGAAILPASWAIETANAAGAIPPTISLICTAAAAQAA